MRSNICKYPETWQPTKATYNTHGWDGWYIQCNKTDTVYFPKKPNSTKKWAIAMAKKLNNRGPDAP